MDKYTTDKRRFDYAKFVAVIEQDRVAEFDTQVVDAVKAWNAEHDTAFGVRFTAGGQVDGGLRKYTWELQGPAAQAVAYLDFERWGPMCTRLDVRIPMPQSEQGIRAFRDYLDTHGTGQRRHGYSNGRVRKKTDRRDAGGQLITIGSHRSDYRCIIYVRGHEMGAIEWLFEGPRVKDAIDSVRFMQQNGYEPYASDPWLAVCTKLWGKGEQELNKDIGMGTHQVSGVLIGEYMPSDVVDSILERIEEQYRALPRSAQLSLLEALEQQPLQTDGEGWEAGHE